MNADKLQLLAVSDRDLKDAEDHLKRLLISHYIDVEDSNVLKKPEWQHLVSQSEDANNEPCRKIRIHTTGQQVVVSGHKDNVLTVSSELADFLTQNAQVEETIVVKPNAKVEYIKRDKSCLEEVEDKVEVFYRNEAICLSGSRIDVTHCKALVEDLVSSLYFDSLKVAKPGAKTVFQDKESMCVQSLWKETGCLVQLIDEKSGGRDDLAFSQVPKPAYQLQTPDGVEIAVCKADLCSYPVCAIISSSTEDLKHSGGLAQALLNAAGPQLQDECNKIINVRGQLKPGDCVITDAGGRLCCKKVIHAVGPKFNPIKGQKVQAQLKKVVKESLELAEKHGCTSVAMPIISRNKGFSLNSCAAAITKAVKEHCDERDDGILKKIHLVNNDDGAVQRFPVPSLKPLDPNFSSW
uniref:Macro domain-containing protein n=1 Tax=Monopterus albus TaxID=43700 RepID=A0A3Q3IPG4_MONAL